MSTDRNISRTGYHKSFFHITVPIWIIRNYGLIHTNMVYNMDHIYDLLYVVFPCSIIIATSESELDLKESLVEHYFEFD